MNKSNSTIPEGYTTITPWIISPSSVKLIEFMIAAFDAVEIVDNRAYNADGSIGHMEARIGTAIVMLFDSKSHWFATRAFLRIFVDDSQAIYDKAMKAGAGH
ncbi:VOC family protein [Sphingobacterium haloxyli]|uniref:Uncharacterized protein n=1 Tax=Sphingobacterium haloxyli TaxID=2100533 RepID=A0A2S9J4V7_9SPHI|nr:hypothetical protein [Sphingobacterium haloxyli]PRD47759.1 hypothetical protein C5745_07525 [Sphingobacterium haloxyli]